MTRPAPRRPSRTTTPRPRRIAGKDAATNESAPPAGPPKRPTARPKPPVAGEPTPADDGRRSSAAPLSSPRLTRTLLVLTGVLVLLLLLQATWFLLNERRDVQVSPAARGTSQDDDGYQQVTVPSGRPVVLDQHAVREGVEAAAAAAQIMFTRDYRSYDDGVENSVTLMTEEFAKQYRRTTDDVRQESIRTKTQVEVRVVAESVVRANDAELEALVFLNQYTSQGEGEDASTTYTPYRAVLKMVHTDNGWLVDGVDTK